MELFQKLTPYKSEKVSEINQVYIDAFDFVFKHNELKNIAISGTFGAGKTSIFTSYMYHKKRRKKIIHISLAHFEELENKGGGDKTLDEARLEAKIINQLVHQITPYRIRKTGFAAKIRNISWPQVIGFFLILIAALIFSFILFQDKMQQFISGLTTRWLITAFTYLMTSEGMLILISALLMIVFTIGFCLLRQSRGNNLLKSLNLKDLSLEISDKKVESYFNKYLSEIRYLFDNSGSTIVAIDDIDRFLSSSIFEKIRELNTIINCGRKKSIRFFYLIKDDIFTSKDRTKFFDFIIPVIPVVDSSNSYGQLQTRLVEQFTEIKFNKKFLRGLSIFIDDMRLLKNIINEFIIYHKLLKEEELNPNKLLAIITYKNIFPKDFNDLQAGTGYLFGLLDSRNTLAENYLEVAREKVNELNVQISAIKNEPLESVDELGALFLKPIANMEKVSGINIDQYKTQLDLYKKIKDNPSKVGIRINSTFDNKDYSNYFDEVEEIPEYQVRKQAIELKAKGQLLKLEEEKRDIERKIQSVRDSHLLTNLLDDTNIDTNIKTFLQIPIKNDGKEYTEITSDIHYQIIPYLIKSGMIDENYKDYLTYFYDNDLKLTDQKFVRAVFAESPLSQNHLLTNSQEILERTGRVSENNPAYINKYLFFYVMNNRMENDGDNFIRLFKKKMSGDLIKGYLHDGKEMTFIISLLNTNWDSFYSDIVVGDKWSQTEKEYYLRLLLIYSTTQALGVVEDINSISHEININGRILEGITGQESISVIPNLLGIDVKFESIPVSYACEKIIEGIYENNLYDLSITNIQFWLQRKYENSVNADIGSILSNVFSEPEEKLSIYVLDSLEDVLYYLFEEDPDLVITDNQETVWRVLESEEVNLEYKENYIKRLSSPVKDIRGCGDEDVLITLIQNDKVIFTLNNLLTLFTHFDNEFTPTFVSYLEKHKYGWVKERRRDTSLFSDQVLDTFFDSVLAESSLDGTITKVLLYATAKRVTHPIIIKNKEKAKALITSRALIMNPENLIFIRDSFRDFLLLFQKLNFYDYCALLESQIKVNPEEIVEFIESGLLNGTQQLSLLRSYQDSVPYKETYRFPGVKKYIIERRLNVNDLQKVVSDQTSLNGDNFRVVKNLIVEEIAYVLSHSIHVPYRFLADIMVEQRISDGQALDIFSNSIVDYHPKQIKNIIYGLDIKLFKEMLEGYHPKYIENPINQKILQALEKKNLVSLSRRGKLFRKGYWG